MTLLSDLEAAAVRVDCMYGPECNGGTSDEPCRAHIFALRLRAHAQRLHKEMSECELVAAFPHAIFERRDLRLYERINDGPLTHPRTPEGT